MMAVLHGTFLNVYPLSLTNRLPKHELNKDDTHHIYIYISTQQRDHDSKESYN